MLLAPFCFDFFPSLSFLLQLFSLLSLSFILCFPCYSLFTCYTHSLLPFISNSVSLFSSIVFPIASLIFPPIRLFHISSLLLSLLPLCYLFPFCYCLFFMILSISPGYFLSFHCVLYSFLAVLPPLLPIPFLLLYPPYYSLSHLINQSTALINQLP